MGLIETVTIVCDTRTCTEDLPRRYPSAREAVTVAQSLGWVGINGTWLCPGHATPAAIEDAVRTAFERIPR